MVGLADSAELVEPSPTGSPLSRTVPDANDAHMSLKANRSLATLFRGCPEHVGPQASSGLRTVPGTRKRGPPGIAPPEATRSRLTASTTQRIHFPSQPQRSDEP